MADAAVSSSVNNSTNNQTRRSQVLVGDLPNDFLRVTASVTEQQIAADHQTAAYLQAGGGRVATQGVFAQPITRLSITCAQARLNKNYGLTKMDPYCRLRVGHAVFETPTSHSGGKNPVWHKVIHAPLPTGVDFVYLEIFDERSFTMDDRVAWAHIPLPARVYNGETVDDWYPLNGKLGDDKEGTVNLVLSLSKVVQQPVAQVYGQPLVYASPQGGVYTGGQQPVVIVQGGAAPTAYPGGQAPTGTQQGTVAPPGTQPVPQPPVPQGPAFTDEDVTAVKEMFPNVEEEVVRSVLEVNRGDKDATINNLLAMDSS